MRWYCPGHVADRAALLVPVMKASLLTNIPCQFPLAMTPPVALMFRLSDHRRLRQSFCACIARTFPLVNRGPGPLLSVPSVLLYFI